MNNQLKQIINQYRNSLKQHYQEKLVKVILYGSQARGEAKADSDIDLLIILKDPVNAWEEIEQTGEFTSNFCLENNVVISRAFVSLSQFNQESLPFFRNVHREGILV
ncbi:nucleotidyltransferase domain-containing protein [Dactylococcopsis salina]|uniref:Nucleotidyltransferase n=1 Tax=Dactylococcopsis salina (strain PCC 8305) TaxID=13035 RepID=K9YSW8_DACS8|nr:nucleotidyltransferase domain-containing protein [Dactylococcopsis salina]AFZ49602.1 putative nucleotidyltransferase [Dactylococcopsis salina PCC 8305]